MIFRFYFNTFSWLFSKIYFANNIFIFYFFGNCKIDQNMYNDAVNDDDYDYVLVKQKYIYKIHNNGFLMVFRWLEIEYFLSYDYDLEIFANIQLSSLYRLTSFVADF